MLRCHAHDHAYQLEIFYTNIEGEAINRIYQAVDEGFDGLVMNPAGFTYAGFALRDCIKGAGLPYVEVHKRNIHCVLSDVTPANPLNPYWVIPRFFTFAGGACLAAAVAVAMLTLLLASARCCHPR